MAYKLTWSPAARDDLHDIVVFIARDNPNRAMSFGYELISETDRLQEFPELGRIVPEYKNDIIRELIDGAAGDDGGLPDQTAEEWAAYRARLEENAAEAARRTKGSH